MLLKLHLSERLPESVVQADAIEDADSGDGKLCCEDANSGDVNFCCDIVRAWKGLKIFEMDVADQVLGVRHFQHGSVDTLRTASSMPARWNDYKGKGKYCVVLFSLEILVEIQPKRNVSTNYPRCITATFSANRLSLEHYDILSFMIR